MSPGSIVLVRFPFADTETTRKRPAPVLAQTVRSPRNRLVTLAMIRSQIEALRVDGDAELVDWGAAGLPHPSLLRVAKVATVDEDLVERSIGELSETDRKAARSAFQHVFAVWVR